MRDPASSGTLKTMTEQPSIPLTVLGGWLGAGKTTMVNKILAATTERLAVIVNDVGDVNIDADLIRNNTDEESDDVIELTNGCVCCKVGDDLYATLHELTARQPAPDRIVLEASGIADPRAIVAFIDHPGVTLDAVIALAEGKGFEYRSSGPPYGSLMRAQLKGADLVVATKLDLVDDDERAESLDELRQFTKAPVIEASGDPSWLNTVVLGSHSNPDSSASETVDTSVATATWRTDSPVDTAALSVALKRSGLLRAKGSIVTADGAVDVHLAGGRVNVTDRATGAAPLNAIVLIGESTAQVNAAAAALNASSSS